MLYINVLVTIAIFKSSRKHISIEQNENSNIK